jgi:hypothetical protein
MLESALPISVDHTQPREATSRQPVMRSARKCWRCDSGRPSDGIASSSAALPAKEAASTANAQPGPAAATSSPDSAGPTTAEPLVLIESSELAACSRSVRTISATMLVDAGPSNAVPTEMMALATASCQICACLVSSSTATAASVSIRAASAPSMRSRRASRSAQTPATW